MLATLSNPISYAMTRKRGVGRPHGLTKETGEAFLTAIRSLNTIADSAAFAGTTDSSIYHWLQRGEEEEKRREGLSDRQKRRLARLDADGKGEPFLQFLRDYRKAKADAKVLLVGRAYSGTKDDPKLAVMILERRHPEEWGRKDSKFIMLAGAGEKARPTDTARERLAQRLDETAKRLQASAQIAVAERSDTEAPETGALPASGLGLRDILPKLAKVE